MHDVTTTRSPNGSAPALKPREQVSEHLRSLVQGLTTRRDELTAELAELDAELRAFQKALAALDPPPPEPPAPAKTKPRTHGVGPERVAAVERAIREIVRENPDGEVTQVQVRGRTGYSSAVMTGAFALLREANVIRLARVGAPPGGGGRTKFFRLTRPGERGDATAPAPRRRHVRSSQPSVLPETRQRVIEAMKATQARGRPITVREVAAAGIGRGSVHTAINELMRDGMLRDLGRGQREGSRGKVPHEYILVEAAPVNTEDVVPPVDAVETEDER